MQVAMPGIMHPMPFKNEAGYESNLNGPAYGAMRQSLTRGSSLGEMPLLLFLERCAFFCCD